MTENLDWTLPYVYVVPSRWTGRNVYAVAPRDLDPAEVRTDLGVQLNQLPSLGGAMGYVAEAFAHGVLA